MAKEKKRGGIDIMGSNGQLCKMDRNPFISSDQFSALKSITFNTLDLVQQVEGFTVSKDGNEIGTLVVGTVEGVIGASFERVLLQGRKPLQEDKVGEVLVKMREGDVLRKL